MLALHLRQQTSGSLENQLKQLPIPFQGYLSALVDMFGHEKCMSEKLFFLWTQSTLIVVEYVSKLVLSVFPIVCTQLIPSKQIG